MIKSKRLVQKYGQESALLFSSEKLTNFLSFSVVHTKAYLKSSSVSLVQMVKTASDNLTLSLLVSKVAKICGDFRHAKTSIQP